MFSQFISNTRGNVAMMTSLAAVMMIGGVGAAIDMAGASNLKSSYQNMADAAVLAAARSRVKDESAMAKIADATVTKLDGSGTNPDVVTTLSADKKYLKVNMSGQYTNKFMQFFGQDNVDVAVMAETIIEINEHAEIVLVLDTTRSMNYDNRLTSLKTAARSFIDIIEKVEADDQVRVAVVPFGQYVNVGLAQRTQTWLDVPADWTETFPTTCSMQQGPVIGQTCSPGVTQPRPAVPARPAQPAQPATYGNCSDDGVTYRCQKSAAKPRQPYQPPVPAYPGGDPTTNCTNNHGPDVRVCTTPPPIDHVWKGCVGSRRNNSNIDADYTVGEPKVPGFLDLDCGDEILLFTSNFTTLRNKINGLTTHGETYSPGGLIWGHRLVDFGEPFPMTRTSRDGEPPRRIVIFMTDGYNTRSRSGELHDGTDRNDADKVSQRICKQMHDDPGIEVYTVSFKVSDTRARRLVKDCASEEDMYYEASDGAKLKKAFEDIAYSLLTPRLTQ